MVEIFRTLGVDAVPGVGQPFDPTFHDAVMREQNDDVPDGTVLQEFRKGFRHGDKLLRPAMVKVRGLSCSHLMQAVGLAWRHACTGCCQTGHQNDAASEEVWVSGVAVQCQGLPASLYEAAGRI